MKNKEIKYIDERGFAEKAIDTPMKDIDDKTKQVLGLIVGIESAVALSVSSVASIFAAGGASNPFSLNYNVDEYVTEEVDNVDSPVVTSYNYEKHNNINKVDMKFEVYGPWEMSDVGYSRTVLECTSIGGNVMKEDYQNNLKNMSMDDFKSFEFDNITYHTQNTDKLSAAELANNETYIKMTSTYKNRVVGARETYTKNIRDIGITGINAIIGFMAELWITYNVLCIMEQAEKRRLKKQEKKNSFPVIELRKKHN